MLRRIALVGLIAGSTSVLGGCGVLSNACEAALPVMQKVQAYGDDAEIALNKLQLTFDSLKLDDAARAKINARMQDAWTSLRTAQAALMAGIDGCRQADALVVFRDFIAVWRGLEVLLGEHAGQLQGSLDAGAVSAMAPAIVQKAGSK